MTICGSLPRISTSLPIHGVHVPDLPNTQRFGSAAGGVGFVAAVSVGAAVVAAGAGVVDAGVVDAGAPSGEADDPPAHADKRPPKPAITVIDKRMIRERITGVGVSRSITSQSTS